MINRPQSISNGINELESLAWLKAGGSFYFNMKHGLPVMVAWIDM
jgi:hypothetical protein